MNKILFLDLEETIIHSWYDPTLCNVDFVKKIIDTEKADEVHIFSYAISNQFDKDHFATNLKPFLESVLNVKIRSWMSIRDLNKILRKFSSVAVDDSELIDLWGKLRGFQDYCRSEYKNAECILVDDVVPNSTWELPDDNLIIRTIKVPT
jgi:hypothetical protein